MFPHMCQHFTVAFASATSPGKPDPNYRQNLRTLMSMAAMGACALMQAKLASAA
jgi:hypothetical protein